MTSSMTHTSPDRRRLAGLTLIEVTLATFIVAVGLVASIQALGNAAVVKETFQAEPETAFTLAYEIQAMALTLPRDTWDGVAATRGAELEVLEDLAGAVFNPPINARLGLRSDLPSWSQHVSLTKVSLDDPESAAVPEDGEAWFWRMDVQVTKGAEQRGHYTWWIQP